MAKLEYFLVAEGICIDQQTNNMSIFNILEEVRTTNFPAVMAKLIAISLWNMDSKDWGSDFQELLRVKMPGEDVPKEFRLNFPAEPEKMRHRIYITIQNLIINAEGIIEVELLLNNKHIASHKITVTKVEKN